MGALSTAFFKIKNTNVAWVHNRSHNYCNTFVPLSACSCFSFLAVIFVYLFSRESKLEKAKQDAKEVLAKQVKVSLKFEIEEVSVVTFPGI